MPDPIPTGVGASFANVPFAGTTKNFTLGTLDGATSNGTQTGTVVITYQPVDPANPGTITLNDTTSFSSSTAVLTIQAGGYTLWSVPQGGATYNFSTTNGANILAMTYPSTPRDFV